MKRPEFILTLSIEACRAGTNVSEILETVELGTFRTEDEARECLDIILDTAGFDEKETDDK